MKHEPWKDIKDFAIKFDQPTQAVPSFPPQDILTLRLKLITEELTELIEAVNNRDLEQTADALVDLQYVVLGTAVAFGLPWPELWNEVHQANMKKIRANNLPSKRGHSSDLIKPEGWTAPNLKKYL